MKAMVISPSCLPTCQNYIHQSVFPKTSQHFYSYCSDIFQYQSFCTDLLIETMLNYLATEFGLLPSLMIPSFQVSDSFLTPCCNFSFTFITNYCYFGKVLNYSAKVKKPVKISGLRKPFLCMLLKV